MVQKLIVIAFFLCVVIENWRENEWGVLESFGIVLKLKIFMWILGTDFEILII